MKLFTYILAIFMTFNCGNLLPKKNNDSKNQNLLLGAVALSQSSFPNIEKLYFKAILDKHEIDCGSHTYTLPQSQVVQVKDFRLFIEDIQFIKSDGTKIPFIFNNVEMYQIRQNEKQAAMLDFTKVGSGACTQTSDNDTVHTAIQGNAPGGIYKGVEITVGVPKELNHQDPSAQSSSSPLRAGTGMTWSWQAGYKFAKIEFAISNNGTPTNDIFRLHLGSTNCTGTAPNVNCANSYRAKLVVEPNGGFNTANDTLVIDVDELFKGNGGVPTSAFGTGVSLSCMPIGNGSGTGGTPQTCGPILKNLGISPGSQAGFGSNLVTETGVGTINETTRQPILKVLRDVTIEHDHNH